MSKIKKQCEWTYFVTKNKEETLRVSTFMEQWIKLRFFENINNFDSFSSTIEWMPNVYLIFLFNVPSSICKQKYKNKNNEIIFRCLKFYFVVKVQIITWIHNNGFFETKKKMRNLFVYFYNLFILKSN